MKAKKKIAEAVSNYDNLTVPKEKRQVDTTGSDGEIKGGDMACL